MSRAPIIVAGRLVIKDDTGKGMDKAKRGITGALRSIATSAAGFLARDVVNALVRVGKESILLGARAETLRRSFENLRDPIEDYDLTLENLRAAVQSTVSDIDLLTAANQAMALGLPRNELDDLFRAAQKVGAAMGRTTLEAVQDLTTGIGRQSKLILDNLGILVDTDTAYEAFAATLGKTASELTTAERKSAFMNAAFEALNETAATLGDNLSDTQVAWEQFQASIKNIKTEIGVTIIPLLADATKGFTTFLNDIMTEIREGDWEGVWGVIGDAFDAVLKGIGNFIDNVDWVEVFRSLGEFAGTLPVLIAKSLFNLGMEIARVLSETDWGEVFRATLEAFAEFVRGFFGQIFSILPPWLQDIILNPPTPVGPFPLPPRAGADETFEGEPDFGAQSGFHGTLSRDTTIRAHAGERVDIGSGGGGRGVTVVVNVGNFIGGDESGARALGEMVARSFLSTQERRGVRF